MAICDLVQATGGQQMVRAAYSSGTPSLGVGAGNSTMLIDETADVEEAARNTRMSETLDFGSGCSADGNLIVEAGLLDQFLEQLVKEESCWPRRLKRKSCRISFGMMQASVRPTRSPSQHSASRSWPDFRSPRIAHSSSSKRTISVKITRSRAKSCAWYWRSSSTAGLRMR